MDDDVLFWVIDLKTNKQYDRAWKLADDLSMGIFRPHQFLMDDDGFLSIANTMDDLYSLDPDRFKPVWNLEHELLKSIVK